ncbi:MAG TPA: hypothetical protein VM695_10815 [Phycisphaerae bacterium]|nr:hypothetical protein [Phycisphaerae bacterium]
MKFFFDRNIARQLARMVAGYETEHEVVHLDDDRRFDPRSQDVFILGSLASEDPKPVFLTGDLNMRTKHPQERKALACSGLTVIFFRKTFHNTPIHEQAMKLLRVWPDIMRETMACSAPTAFEVSANAKLIYTCLTHRL